MTHHAYDQHRQTWLEATCGLDICTISIKFQFACTTKTASATNYISRNCKPNHKTEHYFKLCLTLRLNHCYYKSCSSDWQKNSRFKVSVIFMLLFSTAYKDDDDGNSLQISGSGKGWICKSKKRKIYLKRPNELARKNMGERGRDVVFDLGEQWGSGKYIIYHYTYKVTLTGTQMKIATISSSLESNIISWAMGESILARCITIITSISMWQ